MKKALMIAINITVPISLILGGFALGVHTAKAMSITDALKQAQVEGHVSVGTFSSNDIVSSNDIESSTEEEKHDNTLQKASQELLKGANQNSNQALSLLQWGNEWYFLLNVHL